MSIVADTAPPPGDRADTARIAADYNQLAYPSGVFPQTHPDRLAAIALLHGLSPPPPATARVLELGGGDGLNALAMAAAYPAVRAFSIDIAASPVEAGRALAGRARLANATVAIADVLDTARGGIGTFDYVIAHGLYAWVPPAVREAVMATIGRVLAPNGVAFVSYNAMPGGHVRLALRDLVRDSVGAEPDMRRRAEIAQSVLEAYARPQDGDTPLLRGIRTQAGHIARKPIDALAHDELSEHFAPVAVSDVAAEAGRHGLVYLDDAERDLIEDGFPGDGFDQAAVVRRIQLADHRRLCFFRHSLFVHADAPIRRTPAPESAERLWLSTDARRTGRHAFELAGDAFDVGDDRLADLLADAAAAAPRRIALAGRGCDAERLTALVALFGRGAVRLHAGQLPAMPPSTRPVASALARAQIARGDPVVAHLGHDLLAIREPGPRAFLALLDGTRDIDALRRDWAATPYGGEIDVDAALAMFANAALLVG